MLKKICLILAFSSILFSCKKEITVPTEGIFRGAFNEIRNSGDTVASGVVYLAIWESNGAFTMVGDSITNAPATHNGTYLVDDAMRMHFYGNPASQPIYDVDHYLDTTFDYVFDGDNFELRFHSDTTLYEYVMKRD